MVHVGTDQPEVAAILAEPPGGFIQLVAKLSSSSESACTDSSEESGAHNDDDGNEDDGNGLEKPRAPSFSLSTPPVLTPRDVEKTEGEHIDVYSTRSAPRSARSSGGDDAALGAGRPKKRWSITSQYALLNHRYSINEHLMPNAEDASIDAQYAMLDRRHSIIQDLARHTTFYLDEGPPRKVTEVFDMAADSEYMEPRRRSANDVDEQYAILNSRLSIIDRLSAHHATSSRSARRDISELEVRVLLRLLYARLSAVDAEQLPAAQPQKDASSVDSLHDAVTAAEEVPWLGTVYGRASYHQPRCSERWDSYELLDESRSPSDSGDSRRGSHVSFGHANGDVPRTSLHDVVTAAEEVPWLPTVYGRASYHETRTCSEHSESYELLDETRSPSDSAESLRRCEDKDKTQFTEATVDVDQVPPSGIGQTFARLSTSFYEAMNVGSVLSFLPAADGSSGNGQSTRFGQVSSDEFFGHFFSERAMSETYSQQIVNDGPDRYLWPIVEEEVETDTEGTEHEEEGQVPQQSSGGSICSSRSSCSNGGGASSLCDPIEFRDRILQDPGGGHGIKQIETSESDGRRHLELRSGGSARRSCGKSADNLPFSSNDDSRQRLASDEVSFGRRRLDSGDGVGPRRSRGRGRGSRYSFNCNTEPVLSDRLRSGSRRAAGQGTWSTRLFHLIVGELSMCCQCKGRQGR